MLILASHVALVGNFVGNLVESSGQLLGDPTKFTTKFPTKFVVCFKMRITAGRNDLIAGGRALLHAGREPRIMNPRPIPHQPRPNALVILLAFFLAIASAFAAAPDTNQAYCLMTFNLRYASNSRPNAWPDRRPVMSACLQKYAPDIFGTQEGVYAQLKDLASDLPDYEWIGLGRDGGSRGEFMAVFYRKARFEPMAYDHFWLSDTPEVIASTHWGNTNRRMVTWVRFRDRDTNREFYFVNTHLDHAIREAREKGATLIRQRLGALDPKIPIVLVGDFNAVPQGEQTHAILVAEDFLQDTWDKAPVRRNEGHNTFHNFQGAVKGDSRIDWILTRGPWAIDAVEIVLFSRENQFPSDHHPYAAWLRLTDGPPAP